MDGRDDAAPVPAGAAAPAPAYGEAPTGGDDRAGRPAPRTDPLAVAAAVCGLAGLLLVTIPAAVVLGVVALRRGRSGGRSRQLAVTGIAAACVWTVVLVVTALYGDDLVERPGPVSVYELEVGDCFDEALAPDDDASSVVGVVPRRPCDEPHQLEVYAAHTLRADSWPGQRAVDAEADSLCAASFEEFVGVPASRSSLGYSTVQPGETSFAEGDRQVLCTVFDPTRQVEGSLEGAAR